METTSKVKRVASVKEYTNSYGTTYYHELEMDNGDKMNIGKKKVMQVGNELTYEIVGDKKDDGTYQREFPKAKSVQKEQKPFKKQAGSNASFALSYAKDIAIASYENGGKALSTDNILAVASKFNEWLNNN